MHARLFLCFVLVVSALVLAAHAQQRPAALFNSRCRACHTYGAGNLIGPDLKGVTDRHTREWLRKWITSSQTLVRAGEPAALALFDRFKHFPMPDQPFGPGELDALLDYFAAGGPIADARRNRRAEQATAADLRLGRALFAGERAAAAGGAPCISCHSVASEAGGGTLGPDLTSVYSKFQDRRLRLLIARGCFPRQPDALVGHALSEDEVYALAAYLQAVDPGQLDARPDGGVVPSPK